MRRGLLMVIFLLILIVCSPTSSALWVNYLEGTAPNKDEIILNLRLFDKNRKFGVEYGGDRRLIFICEKTEYLNYSFMRVECTPEELFVVRDEWIMYTKDNITTKWKGHIISIKDDVNEQEVELSIRFTGDKGWFSPFKFNNVDYPFDRYDINIFLMFFTNNEKESTMLPFQKGQTIESQYELNNFNFQYNGTYPILHGDYYGILYETNDMQIKRTFFETTLVGVSLWILVLLLIAILYMVWNEDELGKVIRLYMGFFIPSLFVFGFLQNAGTLAITPLIIFSSILTISTLLLCINVLMEIRITDKSAKQKQEKNKHRKGSIKIIFILWLIGTTLLLLSTPNTFIYIFEWLFGSSFLIFTTILSISLIIAFFFLPQNLEKLKEWGKKS